MYSLLLIACLWTRLSCAQQLDFLSFFGCDTATSLQELQQCDFFAFIGAEVAREAINNDPSKPNVIFHQTIIESEIGNQVIMQSV